MAVNLSALSQLTTSATALSNLILVTPQQSIGYQPQNQPSQDGQTKQQPPALLFNYEGEQTVSLTSDITDHYIEDNTAIQDQIALKPETITTHGFIGELNNVTPAALEPLKQAADKLTVITAYTPELTTTEQLAYANALQAYQLSQNVSNASVAAWNSINKTNYGSTTLAGTNVTSEGLQTQQQLAFQQFYGYWRNRTLFTVQTPWAIFKDMAILSLRAIQDSETRMITDFEVTFKMIRTATTLSTSSIGANFEGRAAFQAGGLTDLGTSTPPSDITLQQALSDNFAGVA